MTAPAADGGGAIVLVATPIGNLGDLPPRAVEALRAADIIACEDTRHSGKLLHHAGITPRRLVAVHAHNEAEQAQRLVAEAAAGARVAVITDAGTPGISDPGERVVAAAVAAGWLVLIRLDARPPGALCFAWTGAAPRELLLGFTGGAVLIGGASLLLLLTGVARFEPDAGTLGEYLWLLLWTLFFFGLAAAYEEAVFRGYALQALVEAVGVWPGVLVSSAVFSAVHAGNPNIDAIAFANIFLAGVLLAFAYLRTRSLWFATAVHAGWNWTMAALLDFPVSGLTAFDTPLYDAVEVGADWWTGGGFGPEAGFAATLVLLAAIGWTVRTQALGEAPEMRELRPIVDRRLGAEGL